MTLDDEYNILHDPETGVPIYPDVTDDSADFIRQRASVHYGANYLEDDIAPPWGSTHGEEYDDVIAGESMSEDGLNTETLFHEEPVTDDDVCPIVEHEDGTQHIMFDDELTDAIAGDVLGEDEIVGMVEEVIGRMNAAKLACRSAYDCGLDEICGLSEDEILGAGPVKRGPVVVTRKGPVGGWNPLGGTRKPLVWKKRVAPKFESRTKIFQQISALGAKVGQKAVSRGKSVLAKSKNPKAQAAAKRAVDLGTKADALAKKLDKNAVALKDRAVKAASRVIKRKTKVNGFVDEILGSVEEILGITDVCGAPEAYTPDEVVYQDVPATGNSFFPEGGIPYDGSHGFPAGFAVSLSKFTKPSDSAWDQFYRWNGNEWTYSGKDAVPMKDTGSLPAVKGLVPGNLQYVWLPSKEANPLMNDQGGKQMVYFRLRKDLVPGDDLFAKEPFGPNDDWGPLVGDPTAVPWANGLRYAYSEGVFWWPTADAPDWALQQAAELEANKTALEEQAKAASEAADEAEREAQEKVQAKEDTAYQRRVEVEEREQALKDAAAAAELERKAQAMSLDEAKAEAELEREMMREAMREGAAPPQDDVDAETAFAEREITQAASDEEAVDKYLTDEAAAELLMPEV